MAMPVLEKSYLFDVNNAYGGVDIWADYKQAMMILKTKLTGFASYPWTVHSSSNGTQAGATDHWGSTADINWASGNHSWIVLNAPIGGAQLCLDLAFSSPYYVYMHWSGEGRFSGGSISARPTADDSMQMDSSSIKWLTGYTWVHTGRMHFIHSTDGELSMWFTCSSGYQRTGYIFCKAQGPQADWELPYCFIGSTAHTTSSIEAWRYGTASVIDYGNELCMAKERAVSGPGNTFWVQLASPSMNDGSTKFIGNAVPGPNGISGKYPMAPIYMAARSVGSEGFLGRIPDLYLLPNTVNTTDSLEAVPASPTLSWVAFGNMAVPWDGSVPQAS